MSTTTKLSRYSAGIMEAAWLAAVIVIPVFFNVYSSRIFEPDKIALLRTLALIILAAWLVKSIEEIGSRSHQATPNALGIFKLVKIPILLPVLALSVIYIVATIFSVTPRVSFWGSYQRLQGTYSTLSYIVIFFAILVNIRKRAQIERLVGAVVIASLPVSLYGVLQRYNIDPIPWGGDVSRRIAANMGNSIFVGAYLIMVFPLTVMRIVESFEALLAERGSLLANFTRATGYVFIATLQVIALFFSGSRGPWLGWGASFIIIWLGLSLIWRKRWLTIGGVVVSIIAALFLVTLNIPNGPLADLQSVPSLGRIGSLLDAESRTAIVRTLIWRGAADLVKPHEPLEYPDGKTDKFNLIRPIIGYGPESMYVAFNPFYPPELTQVEKRNASPDRSHNETWDSLVITGFVGLLVYLSLFGSILYYGLKWIGLVNNAKQRNLFLVLFFAVGLVSAVFFVFWRGLGLLGVALPFGMVVGAIIYLLIMAVAGDYQSPENTIERLRSYLLIGFLAAIVAHFVEINFGIAIAATRTYFWVYSASLLLLGFIYPLIQGFEDVSTKNIDTVLMLVESKSQKPEDNVESPPLENRTTTNEKSLTDRQSKRKKRYATAKKTSTWGIIRWKNYNYTIVAGLIVAILLVTLGYDLVSNSQNLTSVFQIIWNSMVRMRNATEGNVYGVLLLILVTWFGSSAILASEVNLFFDGSADDNNQEWFKNFAVILFVSSIIAIIFWSWHANVMASLARQSSNTLDAILEQVYKSENILTNYYLYLGIIIFLMALLLPKGWPRNNVRWKGTSYIIALGSFTFAFVAAAYTNIRVIQADMAYKAAESFAKPNSWPAAIAIYNHAINQAPNEDYYYLFLGRAYLEYAKSLTDQSEREQLISQAAQDLRKAQNINPLNTDHTANLARLYSLWAAMTDDSQLNEERNRSSSNYFSRAVVLSPNNARLWDEWALHYLSNGDNLEDVFPRLEKARELDPYYDWTYGLLGDYYSQVYDQIPESNTSEKEQILSLALDNYLEAIELSGSTTGPLKSNYFIALAGVYTRLRRIDDAISAYSQALESDPNRSDRWQIFEMIARLNAQMGDVESALYFIQLAIDNAPEENQSRLDELKAQLSGMQ